MSSRRLSPLIIVAVILALAGCSLQAPPQPTSTQQNETSYAGMDRTAVDAMLRDALPAELGADLEVEDGDAFEVSLVIDTSIADHNARRVAGVYRIFSSPGWYEQSAGPGYRLAIDLFLMESVSAASTFMKEVSTHPDQSYVLETAHGTSVEYSAAVQPPRAFLPDGTIERHTTETWPTGESAPGWVAWSRVDAFLLIVSGYSDPDAEAVAALAAADAQLAEFFHRLPELSEKLSSQVE